MDLNEILSKLKNRSKEDIELITKAYDFARMAHEGQNRFSGEQYFDHPCNVAKTLAEMDADTNTVVAGLLHDVCEDGAATPEDIAKEFGKEVAFLVEGVTKLGKLEIQRRRKIRGKSAQNVYRHGRRYQSSAY